MEQNSSFMKMIGKWLKAGFLVPVLFVLIVQVLTKCSSSNESNQTQTQGENQ